MELTPNAGASVSFVLKADTRLSGRMVDAKGLPIKDVCIDLEPLEGRGENGAGFFKCSEKGGEFSMGMMPPGKYLLVAHDKLKVGSSESKSTLYDPGVREREHATAITIEAAKYVKNIELRLPSGEKRYTVAGKLTFSDGEPVSGAEVEFTWPAHGYSESTGTRADGSFELAVIAGMEGLLKASKWILEPQLKSCPEYRVSPVRRGLLRFTEADPIPLLSDSDHEGIQLKLPTISCKAVR